MKHTIYKEHKNHIKQLADNLTKSDQPQRRETLNNNLDQIDRELELNVLREQLSKARKDLYINWLTSYTIARHER